MKLKTFIVLVCAVGFGSTSQGMALSIVDNIPGSFTDISQTGTSLGIGDEGEATINTFIGNAVFPSGNVVVGNNGGVGFAPPSTDLAPNNAPIPSAGAFGGGQAALPHWDDVGNDIGNVYWEVIGNTLIFQWDNRSLLDDPDVPADPPDPADPNRVTFQLQIFGGVPLPGPGETNVFAQFIYRDVNNPMRGGGTSATIGYQDGGRGFNDVQWSFNAPNAVSDGTVLSLVIDEPVPEPSSLAWLVVGGLTLIRRRQ